LGDTMKVPFAKPIMDEEMIQAAANALRNERLVMGESVHKFEEEFARFIGTKHAIAVSSGTAALQMVLIASKVCGKDVITTPLSFIATANAVVQAGATPRFADSRESDYNIDPVQVKSVANDKTAAILPVHLYGQPSEMAPLVELCHKKGLKLIEDAAQAHGSIYQGKRIGSIGDAGCFSFYTTKNMTVGGDGGMVTTNDDELAKEVSKMRDCGRASRYIHDMVGFTARLNTCNAAIGRVQLRHLESWNERRRAIAGLYSQELKGLKEIGTPPLANKDSIPVFHLYVIRSKRRDELASYLSGKGIETVIHYPVPIHLQPVYVQMYGYKEGSYPISERLSASVLSLPLFPEMKDEEVRYVCEQIKGFYGGV
jgi:perosamine synthetase